jgi:hypothetical protein
MSPSFERWMKRFGLPELREYLSGLCEYLSDLAEKDDREAITTAAPAPLVGNADS